MLIYATTTMWEHLRAIVLLPGIVTVVVPAIIIYRTGTEPFFSTVRILVALLGLVLVGLGLVLLVATIRHFANTGKGTLAPWNPTSRLVVEGVYRHVRNPIISGVFAILLGESLIAGSIPLFVWFLVFVTINAIYLPLFEEPGLRRRFSADHEEYRRNVPRWIPRLKPWVKTTTSA